MCVQKKISWVWHPVLLQGEGAAVEGTLDALTECLQRPMGCAVVPGLPGNQYQLTLVTSVLGGFVAGYASRLQPEGAPHETDMCM